MEYKNTLSESQDIEKPFSQSEWRRRIEHNTSSQDFPLILNFCSVINSDHRTIAGTRRKTPRVELRSGKMEIKYNIKIVENPIIVQKPGVFCSVPEKNKRVNRGKSLSFCVTKRTNDFLLSDFVENKRMKGYLRERGEKK